MFFLSEIEHTFRLSPKLLDLPLQDAIKVELDSIFLDKVIEKLGLCVSIYDIRSIDGGFVVPGEGAFTYKVKLRIIMFRPFVGEVISARLKESTQDGLRLTLGFFDDIYVPFALLPTPNHYERDLDSKHKNWVLWRWDYEEGESYPIDSTSEIRFRVHNVSYPPLPLHKGDDSEERYQKDGQNSDKNASKGTASNQRDTKPFAPMVITGSIDSEGLGPMFWWV